MLSPFTLFSMALFLKALLILYLGPTKKLRSFCHTKFLASKKKEYGGNQKFEFDPRVILAGANEIMARFLSHEIFRLSKIGVSKMPEI